MLKKINWPLTVLFVWLFLFLIFAASREIAPRFCNASMLEAISKQQDVLLFNCPEFWLNRYQSFLGNLVTAGVAGYTLYWLIRQLKAANRQAAVAAAQSLRLIAAECFAEKKIVEDILDSAQKRKITLGRTEQGFGNTIDLNELLIQSRSNIDYARTTKDKFDEIITIHPGDKFGSACLKVFHQCDVIRIIAQDIERELRFGPKPEQFVHGIDAEWISARGRDANRLREAMALIEQYLSNAGFEAGQRHSELWDQIREFEAAAITGH